MAAACTGGAAGGGGQGAGLPGSYPRNETLYISGTQWGPPANWNPIMNWEYATGTEGLVYEPLFLYDPYKDEYRPWLAESGEWTSDNVYEARLREGVEWSDGEPFTAEDVVFTFELGKFESVPYHNLWDWLESAEAVDEHTVRFTFAEALYQEWSIQLYNTAIVPKHLWEGRSEKDVAAGANKNPVGTGAYLYHTHSQDRNVWTKNENWWAQEALDLDVAPKYIVDIVNSSNEAALGQVLQGGIDLSNNFLPGISTLVQGGYQVQTYYDGPPYMLSANTAWLVMNTTKKPTDDPAFRRALAHAIDVDKIVNSVYGNIVRPASPTGLLPPWEEYVDKSVVDDLGFSHDPAEAKRILANAGYQDTNGDGLVEAPDGSKIELSLIVPSGWTDWEESIRVIAESAEAAGIDVRPEFPDFDALVDARDSGNYDMLINNEKQLSSTPWEYYDYIFRLPVQETQTTANFGRYENQKAWDLVQELDKTQLDDAEGMKTVASQLQRIHLQEMPVIPLWYNGLWAQTNSSVWTNWPSAAEDTPDYAPATWRNWMEMGGILTITELQPAPPAEEEG